MGGSVAFHQVAFLYRERSMPQQIWSRSACAVCGDDFRGLEKEKPGEMPGFFVPKYSLIVLDLSRVVDLKFVEDAF